MNKNYQNSYCMVCKNRKYDIMQGIYCGLTKLKPQFKNDCPSYEVDKNEEKRLLARKRLYFRNQMSKNKRVESFLSSNYIEYKETCRNEKFIDNLIIHNEYEFKSVLSFRQFIKAAIVVFILVTVAAPIIQFLKEIDIFFSALILLIFIYLLLAVSKKYSFNPMNEIVLSIDKKGIREKDGELINWQDVLLTTIKIKNGERTVPKYLLVSRISTINDVIIEITNLEVSLEELGHIIEIFKEKYKQNYA